MARPKETMKDRRPKPKKPEAVRFTHWLNPDAAINPQQRDAPGTKYRCTCCGMQYDTQGAYFYKSLSPLYEGNNGYISVCKACIKAYGDYLERSFGSESRYATERFCQIFDYYYNDDVYERAADTATDGTKSIAEIYVKKALLKTFTNMGTTYMDTLKDRANMPTIPTLIELDENGEPIINDENEQLTPTDEQVEMWGLNFTYDEYQFLDMHYRKLKQQCDPDDPMQDIYVKDMCMTKVFQNRAISSNDSERFTKLQKSYQDTALKANLKPVSVDAATQTDSDKTFGVFLDMVEKYTPSEIYGDRKLFADWDGIGDYIQKTLVRSVKNFLTGSAEKDEDFAVTGGDDNA